MTPGPLQLPTIWRGCTWQPTLLKWKDANGNPFDLTGWVGFAQTRSGNSLNVATTNVAGGETTVSMSFEETAAMKLGVEQWDWVWVYDLGGPDEVRYPPILYGTVLVDQPTARTTAL